MLSARTKTYLTHIAGNLHRARTRAGMTQEQLAEKSDLDLRFLQRVERAKTNFGVGVLVALADALDVPPGSFFKKAVLPEVQLGRPTKKKRRTQ